MRTTWIPLIALAAGCDEAPTTEPPPATDTTQVVCAWDTDDDLANAGTAAVGQDTVGFLCPLGDQDWYTIDLAGQDLLTVTLAMEAPVTPVNPTYTIWDATGTNVVGSPQATESAAPGQPLTVVHGLGAGSYAIAVRDGSSDAEDVRHSYTLTLAASGDADTNEPNDDAGSATSAAGSQSAYISYRGDQDWYAVDVQASGLITVRLTSAVAGYEPTFRVVDAAGETLITQTNEAGTREATDISYTQPAETPGTYHVVVEDNDALGWDTAVPYTVEISAMADPDLNEPNDHPDDATDLGSQNCQASWGSWSTHTGYIASNGDIDWYMIRPNACGRGIMEAEVTFNNPGSLPPELQAEVRVVRASNYTCQLDQACQELPATCGANIDCAYLGSTCLASGRCAGAGVCLPFDEGCGATLISEIASAANPGTVTAIVPLRSGERKFVAVVDHLGDALSATHSYTLRLRFRDDPDLTEPNDEYTGGPPEGNDADYHIGYAADVPVHDCTAPANDCCGPGTWETGNIGYRYDQDWYRYTHPCPGSDCMVRVNYQLDGGVVDTAIRVFEGNRVWFDGIAGTTDRTAPQPQRNGAYGGLGAADECFYAFQGHSGSPFYYYLSFRDTVFVDGANPVGGTWDADSEQTYRFCVEKLANTCQEPPCQLFTGGCDEPYP